MTGILLPKGISEDLLKKIPAGVARRYNVIPKGYKDGRLVVLSKREVSANDKADLVFLTGEAIICVPSESKDFEALLNGYCAQAATTVSSVFSDMERFQESESRKHGLDLIATDITDSPVNLVDAVVSFAIGAQASDVHFESTKTGLMIRARIDGVLREIATASELLREAIVSRTKLLARMDVAEKRLPQDGRFTMSGTSKAVDIRVSSFPTAYGEKVVMRLLDPSSLHLNVDQLRLNAASRVGLLETLAQPQGLILVTGPTGSGKTTTLYACLRRLASPGINVMTIEDPKEYNLHGINQSQVKPEIGYTFASALRSILRQDPDVIMVGEIRDSETAQIAIRASLTGHLVLSTVHTNDAVSTIDRLIDMGIEPYLVASSLRAVVSQRLVRLHCGNCRGLASVKLGSNAALLMPKGGDFSHTAHACANCSSTGYSGRQAIFELLRISATWREAIRNSDYRRPDLLESPDLLSTMAKSAADLVRNGATSREEVLRVLGR